MGFYQNRKIHIGPLSTRYNLNCRLARDSHTRILHFNIDTVKPWDFTLSEAQGLARSARADALVWGYVAQWLELEEKINITFSGGR